jgi:hypothetical protein
MMALLLLQLCLMLLAFMLWLAFILLLRFFCCKRFFCCWHITYRCYGAPAVASDPAVLTVAGNPFACSPLLELEICGGFFFLWPREYTGI